MKLGSLRVVLVVLNVIYLIKIKAIAVVFKLIRSFCATLYKISESQQIHLSIKENPLFNCFQAKYNLVL